MSKVPPKRSGQSSSTGGASRSSQSGQPARSNRPVPPRQPQQYAAEDDWDEEYDEQDYAPPPRAARQQSQRPPARNSGYQQRYSGPPPRSSGARRRPPPRYVEPKRDMFPILMGGLIGLGVVGIMVIAFLLLNRPNTTTTAGTTTNNDTSSGTLPVATMVQNPSGQQTMQALRPAEGLGTAVPDEGNAHVDDGTAITYKVYPPSSGTHYNDTAPYGFSDVQLKEGNLVHSLEHGAIVIYYKSSVSADIKQKLKDAYNTLPAGKYGKVKLVVTPYENMTTPLAIAAWDRLLLMNEFKYDEIQTFYTTWVDKGPEDVP